MPCVSSSDYFVWFCNLTLTTSVGFATVMPMAPVIIVLAKPLS